MTMVGSPNVLNSATSYPRCSVFVAFAALLWRLSVLVSLGYLREDSFWLRLRRAVFFCGYSQFVFPLRLCVFA